MTINKNDHKYNTSFTSKKAPILAVRNVKIRKDNNNTKLENLEFLIKPIQSGVKSVYNKRHRGNLHQFQCYTM